MTRQFAISNRFRFRFVLLLVWAAIILWLSLDPSPPVPQHDLLGWDKLQHAGAYALLTFLIGVALNTAGSSYRTWVLAAVSSVVYGSVIEVLQACWTRNRSAEAGDLLADAVGAAVAVAVVLSLRWFRNGRLPER